MHFSLINNLKSKRIFDLLILFLLSPVIIMIGLMVATLVLIFSGLPVIYWSERVGINNEAFLMPKFRTMNKDAPQIATELFKNSNLHITKVGWLLRKTSIDEWPQFWSILKGDMSLVGPRPALFNQDELIKLRTERGVNRFPPGLTGLAQINGRDDNSIHRKLQLDEEYVATRSLYLDIKILILTLFQVISCKNITH